MVKNNKQIDKKKKNGSNKVKLPEMMITRNIMPTQFKLFRRSVKPLLVCINQRDLVYLER